MTMKIVNILQLDSFLFCKYFTARCSNLYYIWVSEKKKTCVNIFSQKYSVRLLPSANVCDSGAAGFYILLRAVDRFAANYNSFPGQFDG